MTIPRAQWCLTLLLVLGCTLPPPSSLQGQPTEAIQDLNNASIKNPLLPQLTPDLSDGMSPDEAALFAILFHPDLKALRDENGLAEAAILAAGLLPNPSLSVSADIPIAGATEGTNVASGAAVSWDVSSLLRRDLLVEIAKAHKEDVIATIAWREWEYAEEAKRLAWRVYYLSQKAKLSEENETLLKASYDLLQKAVALGEKTGIEASAAEVAWRDAKEVAFLARADEAEAKAQLKQSIGLIQDLPPITVSLSQSWQAQDAQTFLAGLEDHRLDLVALRYAHSSEDAAVRAAIQAGFPAFGVEINVARDNSALNTAGAALQIDLPVLQKNEGAIETEKATRQQLADEYAARFYEAQQKIKQLSQALETAIAHRTLLEEIIPSLEALNKNYQRASEGGFVDILSRYAAQDLLAQKRLALIDVELTLSELTVALELESGVLITAKKP